MAERTAFIQTPGDIETRVERLSSHWNDLRNAALGRGTKPVVSPKLAEVVGDRFERWRVWYQDNTFADNIIPANVWDAVTEWERVYSDTRARALAELPPEAVPSALEAVVREQPGDTAQRFGIGLGLGLALGAGAFFAYRSGGVRRIFRTAPPPRARKRRGVRW